MLPTGPQLLQMVAAVQKAQSSRKRPIKSTRSPYEFSQQYRPIHGRGEPVNFKRYPHLADLYRDIARNVVVMAGAQSGKTLWQYERTLWSAVEFWGRHIGIYYPDNGTAQKNSLRFEEVAKSRHVLGKLFGASDDVRSGSDSLRLRTLGPSTLYFQSIEGKATTESTPMTVVLFDELRSMSKDSVRRAEERTSGQEAPHIIKVSTAAWPNSDIHAAFKQGDQKFFHSECRCPDGVSLSEVFPDCVVDLKGATPELKRKVEHACTMAGVPYCGVSDEDLATYGPGILMCPTCGTFILNPRDGWWVPHNPDSPVSSWQFAQMLNPVMSGPRLAQKLWRPASGVPDMGSMYRDVAGMPYIGAEDRPLSRDLLESIVRTDLIWPANQNLAWRRKFMTNTAMGIDHMKGYNCIWIKQRAPNGKARTVHLEVAHGGNPWVRCGQLMHEYDVGLCVIEEGPNYNEALAFADAFKGRVYLLHYSPNRGGDLARWRLPSRSVKGDEVRSTRYVVTVNQDRAMQWSIGQWQRRAQEMPPPTGERGLYARLKTKDGRVVFSPELLDGEWNPVSMAEDVIFPHLEAVAFMKDYRDKEGEKSGDGRYDLKFQPIGMDPHFALAGMMADLALSRLGGIDVAEDYSQPHVTDTAEDAMSAEEIRARLRSQ